MFTGLIEACVQVQRVEIRGLGARVWVAAPRTAFDLEPGQSVSVSGACLTVVADEAAGRAGAIAFDLSAETLERTWFGSWKPGDFVNLERALKLGDRLDGHMVAGHVDGRGRVVGIADAGDGGKRLTFEVDAPLARWLFDKGSITVDGISLTVVEPKAASFHVAVIPLTLERTSLGRARAGQAVNIEADLVGKWVERLIRRDG